LAELLKGIQGCRMLERWQGTVGLKSAWRNGGPFRRIKISRKITARPPRGRRAVEWLLRHRRLEMPITTDRSHLAHVRRSLICCK
jgi:hypothetical protein